MSLFPISSRPSRGLQRPTGSDDTHLLPVLETLSFAYAMAGRLEDAASTGVRTVSIMRSTIPGSSAFGLALANHAGVLRRMGQLDEARTLLEESLSLPEARTGAHSISHGILASTLDDLGDLEGAIREQRKAIESQASDPGSNPGTKVHSHIKLAGFLRRASQYRQAESVLNEALTLHDPNAPMGHGEGRLEDAFVDLYEAWGRPDKADEWRRE